MNAATPGHVFSFSAFLELITPDNLLIVAFAQVMTAVFLVKTSPSGLPVMEDPKLYLLILSTVLLTASGCMINDYYDVKIDYVNTPDEVVFGKNIKRRAVMFLHTITN